MVLGPDYSVLPDPEKVKQWRPEELNGKWEPPSPVAPDGSPTPVRPSGLLPDWYWGARERNGLVGFTHQELCNLIELLTVRQKVLEERIEDLERNKVGRWQQEVDDVYRQEMERYEPSSGKRGKPGVPTEVKKDV